MMDSRTLYDTLKKINEPKGYFFNKDERWVFDLLDSLLINKERYGYMSCPCRLAANDRQKDSDIICPCAYREQDIAEYGSCYCNLYVSGSWNESDEHHPVVPERRPPERMF
ncbi:MAG: Ferredoxin thioredoxin reductase catalytic beta chain [Syntrophus sp. PtaU1.Bin005]|nr:MAG: Ferredoxin thioredoxin reductase catalytic beta chain [Syntrophus sp. PtaB.Bin138]OPY80684.1 MAG: Ferredoxin thioredoxin reductase catalytic beta chain [Syntrophus sp. PtaU1.Bin005]